MEAFVLQSLTTFYLRGIQQTSDGLLDQLQGHTRNSKQGIICEHFLSGLVMLKRIQLKISKDQSRKFSTDWVLRNSTSFALPEVWNPPEPTHIPKRITIEAISMNEQSSPVPGSVP